MTGVEVARWFLGFAVVNVLWMRFAPPPFSWPLALLVGVPLAGVTTLVFWAMSP
jgi:hypothetical protein